MRWHPVPDLPAFLEGRWSVDRDLVDGDRRGRFRGTATFAREGDGVAWDETGEADFGDHRGPARRRLRIVPHGDGWQVCFEDGRPFHDLDLAGGRCEAGHDCRADRYDGTFSVLAGDAFDVVWHVRGPAKRQEITSRYRRS